MANQNHQDFDHEKGRIEGEGIPSYDEFQKRPVAGEPIAGSGDDAQVRWTFARFVAFVSLCFVYVGSYPDSTSY